MSKKQYLVASLAFAALAAQAAGPIAPTTPFTPFLGLGLTFGGDQVGQDIAYSNGNGTSSIYAGGLIDLRGGLEYQASGSPLSFQLSIGYHVHRASADNGSVNFSRVPLEALMHYRLNESWRIGGGLRKALSAESSTSGAGQGWVPDTKYKSSPGIVLEAEVFFGPRLGLKLRGVKEDYTSESFPREKLDGSHVGVIGVYYFK